MVGEILYMIYPKQLHSDIIVFYHMYTMGGAERVHADILEAISSLNPNLIICDRSTNDHFFNTYAKFAYEMIDMPALSQNKFVRNLMFGYISKMINQHRSKVVLFGSYCSFYYKLLPLLKKDKYIAIDIVHNLHPGSNASIELFSLSYVSYLSKRIVINPRVATELKELYFKKNIDIQELNKIEIIENGVNIPSSLFKKSKQDFKLIYVGRCSKEKRIDIMGEVAYLCSKSDFQLKVTFIGIAENCMIEKYRKYCCFTGEIENPIEYYKAAHMIMITSIYEGFPMAIMEAMSYGVVPISTNVGGIGYHIKDEINGFLVDEEDEKKIALQFVNKIQYLIKSKKFDMLSSQAYEYSKRNFSKEIFRKKYMKLFTKYLK